MSKTLTSKKLPFKVGADPEFLIFHGVRALDAQNMMSAFFARKSGMRQAQMGYKIDKVGEIGWDGAASTGELRPEPSDSPAEVVNKIGTLIGTMHKHLPFLDYTTLSIGSPIGGHVHLDAPAELVQLGRGGASSTEQQKEMNRVQKLLASFLMPIVASEHRVSSNSRLAMDYGRVDDMRWDQRGSQGTIEVRGMSAEWITSPKIAMATLAYMGVVWHELLKHNKELIKEKSILKTKGHIDAIQRMMLSDYKPIEDAIIRSMQKIVRGFELYPQFKEEIELILHPREAMAIKDKAGWNLTDGWKITSDKVRSQPTKKTLLSDKKVADRLKSADHTAIEQGFHVPYNDDYNMQLFAKAITDRIAGLNWKLSHEYFLFGLKKGIEGYAAMRTDNKKFYAIPLNQDKDKTQVSCEKMAGRFEQEQRNSVRIDPKTGKTRRNGSNQIVIGIPYSVRAENNTKSLVDLVWSIEHGKISPKELAEFEVEEAPAAKEPEVNSEQVIETSMEIMSGRGRNGGSNTVSVDQDTLAAMNDTPAN